MSNDIHPDPLTESRIDIAAAPGERDIACLGRPGVIIAGPSTASTFDDLYDLERARRPHYRALTRILDRQAPEYRR